MHIRAAVPADLDFICEFNTRLAQESEGKTLDAAVLRIGVAAVLADAGKGQYFLAERDGEPIGQMAFTREWSDWRNGWFWWIQSVYVHENARRQGVFSALYEHLESAAKSDPEVIGIRLYVEDENRTAHATYEKLGLAWSAYRVMDKYPLE